MDCIELEIEKVITEKNSQIEFLKKLKVGNRYTKNGLVKKIISIDYGGVKYSVSYGGIGVFDEYVTPTVTMHDFYKDCDTWELFR